MDLRGIVDRLLRTESTLSHGEVVEALVLNRLTSPRPLYRIEEWARGIGVDVLTERDPARYNDDRIGRTLDVLGDRVDDVQAALTIRAIEVFGLAVSDTHYDTTTLLLEGDYAPGRSPAGARVVVRDPRRTEHRSGGDGPVMDAGVRDAPRPSS